MARLLYGTGMRLMECVRLRVKDVDFARREILIRDGKGAKDRVTMLPDSVVPVLQSHFQRRRALFDDDSQAGKSAVYMPDALSRKYPNSPTEWAGSIFFLRAVIRLTRAAVPNAAIISMKSCCSVR